MSCFELSQGWTDAQRQKETNHKSYKEYLGQVYKRVVAKRRGASALQKGRGKKKPKTALDEVRRWPAPTVEMTVAQLQALMPEACKVVISKDTANKRWLARWARVYSCSRSWALHTPEGAAKEVARQVWRSHLLMQGLAEQDCEIRGLF